MFEISLTVLLFIAVIVGAIIGAVLMWLWLADLDCTCYRDPRGGMFTENDCPRHGHRWGRYYERD